MTTQIKSLTEWASELKVEKSQLSRWLSGITKKVPAHVVPILPIVKANLKEHKSSKILQQNIATNCNLVDLATNSLPSKQWVESSNLSREIFLLNFSSSNLT